MIHFPVALKQYQPKRKQQNKTIINWGYPEDLNAAYAFYCARYENISYSKFLKLGFIEFKMKFSSIPKDEPLFEIIKSRVINLGTIKNKEEKKYWAELKKVNAIPTIYLSNSEIDENLKEVIGNGKKPKTIL